MSDKRSNDDIKKAVRDHYGEAIKQSTSCCSPSPDGFDTEAATRFVQLAGYSENDLTDMPEHVTTFGCGNPVNFIKVKPGQTVLDLGSGAGMDLILAARRVGPEGKVIGLDMTPEMIDTCRRNLAAAGIANGEVRQGEMEHMPVADNEVDWIISNCVINLSPEKEKVFAEAFRVLKPGGRMLVSDIVTHGLPEEDRDDIAGWVGCIAGAVEEDEYVRLVQEAGFVEVEIVDRLVYTATALGTLTSDACGCCGGGGTPDKEAVERYAGKVTSVKLSARRPE